jgi:hypothetical protein
MSDSIATVLDSLSAAWAFHLTGVNIFSGPVGVEEAGLECVAFGNGKLVEVNLAGGGIQEETWTIGGEVRVVRSWQGSTEQTIAAARTRAEAIWAIVATSINDTYIGQLPHVDVTGGEIVSSVVAEGRECRRAFELTIQIVTNP